VLNESLLPSSKSRRNPRKATRGREAIANRILCFFQHSDIAPDMSELEIAAATSLDHLPQAQLVQPAV
jgi:hypothetical protein